MVLVRTGLEFQRCCDYREARIKEGVREKVDNYGGQRQRTVLKNFVFTGYQILSENILTLAPE